MTDAADAGLRRVLGPVSATCIVVGAIVGVGIFFTPSNVARIAGSGEIALWTWAAGGLLALLGALTFAELGGMYGSTGAQYTILRDAWGGTVGFLFVFCNSTAILSGAAAIIAVICAENIGVLVAGAPPDPIAKGAIGLALIGGLGAANVVGVRWGSTIQNVTVFAKVGTLLLVFGLALFGASDVSAGSGAPSPPGSPDPWVLVVFAGLVPALFSFGGWQHALWIGGEVKDPRRNVPFAIVVGILVVIAVYLLANWAYLRLLGYDAVVASRTLAADAVGAAWPEGGSRFVAGAVAFSAFGVLNAQLLSGPRLLYGMARDGRFFSPFARVHRRFATPAPAILLIGTLGASLAVTAVVVGIDPLLNGVVLVDAVFFILTGGALFVLRFRRPDADRPVRAFLYPVVPALFILGEGAVIVGAFRVEAYRGASWIGVAWIAAGLVLYLAVFARRERESAAVR